MLYRELAPPEPLRRWVKCLWVLEHDHDSPAGPEKILPDGRAELIFNLGTPYRWPEVNGCQDQPRSFVVGQIRRFIEVVPAGPTAMIGARLDPTALHPLVGPMHELTDRSPSLEELGLTELAQLEERLQETEGWGARVALLAEALTERLASEKRRGESITEATRLLRESHGRLDLGTVARSVGVSTRTMERRFAVEVGLPPKLYARQVRLQHVFELLRREPRPSWSQISLASGCFDQAHLNREFREFAGEPPAAFLRSRHELSDHLTGLAEASVRV